MPRFDDDFEEFEFADSAAVDRILREQRRDKRRFASRRYHGPEDENPFDDSEDYGGYDDYDDYDDDEFDKYSGIRLD